MLYLAAAPSSHGLLLLTVLIKLHSSTNKAKGLNMKMNDGGRAARIIGYDLYVSLARALQEQQHSQSK